MLVFGGAGICDRRVSERYFLQKFHHKSSTWEPIFGFPGCLEWSLGPGAPFGGAHFHPKNRENTQVPGTELSGLGGAGFTQLFPGPAVNFAWEHFGTPKIPSSFNRPRNILAMYIHIYIYTYICTYISICIYTYTYTSKAIPLQKQKKKAKAPLSINIYIYEGCSKFFHAEKDIFAE